MVKTTEGLESDLIRAGLFQIVRVVSLSLMGKAQNFIIITEIRSSQMIFALHASINVKCSTKLIH
jgi:hypothetical protein